jgi:hypothetical protein
MFVSVERYVTFIGKHKLTQPQFLFLYLIKFKKWSALQDYRNAFPHDDGSTIGRSDRQDLIDRGFIIHHKEKGIGPDAYETTKVFNDLYVTDVWEAADEVWKKYPGFVRIGGRDVPLTNVDRYQFQLLYGERIGYSVDEHNEVLKDLDYGIKHGLVRQNIEKFVRSQAWEKIRQVRLNEQEIAEVKGASEHEFE